MQNSIQGPLQVVEMKAQHLEMNKKDFIGTHESLKSSFVLAYKLIRVVINCEQPMRRRRRIYHLNMPKKWRGLIHVLPAVSIRMLIVHTKEKET